MNGVPNGRGSGGTAYGSISGFEEVGVASAFELEAVAGSVVGVGAAEAGGAGGLLVDASEDAQRYAPARSGCCRRGRARTLSAAIVVELNDE